MYKLLIVPTLLMKIKHYPSSFDLLKTCLTSTAAMMMAQQDL